MRQAWKEAFAADSQEVFGFIQVNSSNVQMNDK